MWLTDTTIYFVKSGEKVVRGGATLFWEESEFAQGAPIDE